MFLYCCYQFASQYENKKYWWHRNMQKCQIVKNHKRFGHSPSSVWKPLSSRDCSFENNGTKRAGKTRRARCLCEMENIIKAINKYLGVNPHKPAALGMAAGQKALSWGLPCPN